MKAGISGGLSPGMKTGCPPNNSNNYRDCFIFSVNTTKTGSASNTFILPTTGSGYSFWIDWGDGSGWKYKSGTPGNITYVYGLPGIYQIKIRGVFPQIYFNSANDYLKIVSIDQWGTGAWTSFARAFYGCSNLVAKYKDTPNTSAVTSFFRAFQNCSLFNGRVDFDTSNVTDMSYMFNSCSIFNQPVPFNTAKVTLMPHMFDTCTKFNQTVNHFNTALVTSFLYMLASCNAFNQPVSNFNTVSATDMSYMFSNSPLFNQDVSNFNTASVTTLERMFASCTAFKQSLAAFNIASVTNINNMLLSCNINVTGTTNYDNTLVAWAAQTVHTGLALTATSCKYSDTGQTARNTLTNVAGDNWTITDGGHA